MNVLITGATGDLGSSIVKVIKENYRNCNIYQVNRKDTPETFYQCDLTKESEVIKLCDKVMELDIDVLINCAGWSTPIPLEKLNIEDINSRMTINFYTPLLLMKAVLPKMKENKKGIIINISSVTAASPVSDLHIYSAAKSALDSITVSAAVEYSKYNIRINGIRPGSVNTTAAKEGRKILGKLRGIEPEMYEKKLESINGYNRLLDVGEISKVVLFLMSNESSGINGQIINVCGTMEVH